MDGQGTGRIFNLPRPGEPQGPRCTSAQRVVQAGGFLADMLLPEGYAPFERIFRRLPDDGIFSASRTNPLTMEVGAFTVPPQQALIIAEYGYTIFRFNGAIAGDYLPMESGRLALSVGTDLNFSQFRRGNVVFEIVPVPPPTQNLDAFNQVPTGGTAFPATSVSFTPGSVGAVTLYPAGATAQPNPPGSQITPPSAPPSIFQQVASAIKTQSAGSALQPNNGREQQGPQKFPFSFIVDENNSVQLRITLFGAINVPVAFFESRIAGYLMSINDLKALLEGVRPCG
jgi:hypothetical protein